MALADYTFVIRASFPERRILGAILRSNVIQPILRVTRHPSRTPSLLRVFGRTRPDGSVNSDTEARDGKQRL
jgi:hypothetical protein